MSIHLTPDTKVVLVSAISGTAIELAASMPFERVVSFGIQSAIGLCTILYLLTKWYFLIKNKKDEKH